MTWDVAGLGNAIMDALVILDDDTLLNDLGLTRGTMHPVDHDRWQEIFAHVERQKVPVTFASGGSCANTIATVGELGGHAIYRGQVGSDAMGEMYAELIEKACGQHALAFAKGASTGKCLSIISRADAERTMVTDLGASIHLPGLGDFAAQLERTKVAHFTGYTLLGGPMKDTVYDAMRLAKASKALISVDAADPFVVHEIRDVFWSVLREFADIVFLNEEEARSLSERHDAEDACRSIADQAGLTTTIVKLGGRGSLVLHEGELIRVPIHAVDAVDTTGAGDAYAGGYLFGLTRGWGPTKCGALATRIAGRTVAQIGAVVQDREALAALIAEVD